MPVWKARSLFLHSSGIAHSNLALRLGTGTLHTQQSWVCQLPSLSLCDWLGKWSAMMSFRSFCGAILWPIRPVHAPSTKPNILHAHCIQILWVYVCNRNISWSRVFLVQHEHARTRKDVEQKTPYSDPKRYFVHGGLQVWLRMWVCVCVHVLMYVTVVEYACMHACMYIGRYAEMNACFA